MKNLLIEEMKRAIQIMERNETIKFSWGADNFRDLAELKQILAAVRKHSILLEKESK